MTAEEIERLEALEKAATPGPWVVDEIADEDGEVISRGFGINRGSEFELFDEADASLIVELRNAASALVAAAKREQQWPPAYKQAISALGDALDEKNALERRVVELTEALRPFAEAATRIENYHGPVFGENAPASDFGSELDELTMGDFRAARATLAKGGAE